MLFIMSSSFLIRIILNQVKMTAIIRRKMGEQDEQESEIFKCGHDIADEHKFIGDEKFRDE